LIKANSYYNALSLKKLKSLRNKTMELLWIAVAYGCGLIARYIQLPALVGYLAAGFMLNLWGFETTEMLEFMAHTGVLLLLFSVGLKLRLKNVVRI